MAAPAGVRAALWRVWGSGPNDVFAVGEAGTVIHYDGLTWTKLSPPTSATLRGVWGSGPGDVFFAAGSECTLLHYSGSAWTQVPFGVSSCGLAAVWGSGPADVYAVGTAEKAAMGALRVHFDGKSWSAFKDYLALSFDDMWGTGPSNIYALGSIPNQSVMRHYDGTMWSTEGNATWFDATPIVLNKVWGTNAKDVYAVGSELVHFDGQKWSKVVPRITGTCGWASGPSDVFVGSAGGKIFHFDGKGWTEMVSGTTEDLWSLWGSSAGDVFAVGKNATILHYTCSR